MLIVGAYPDALDLGTGDRSPIQSLETFLDATVPSTVGVHLLPFFPTSGDSGFAIDDWFTVRPELGTWSDVQSLAATRRLIVDGVYNHVGMGHEWVQRFLSAPDTANEFLHAYRTVDASAGPSSPRGQPVLRPFEVAGDLWHLWQTFSNAAVDIRLENPLVVREIDRQLQLFRANGVWGVRLDAISYFAKSLGSNVRHNPGVFKLADSISALVEAREMRVMAQLDCDAAGQRYFSGGSQADYVVNDFSYAPLLALATITGNPAPLVRHLISTASVRQICLRAPRTHDGLLLRSGLLEATDRSELLAAVSRHGIKLRSEGGVPYELNCSGPYLYALGRPELLDDAIELTVAVTGMTTGWSYFYLPFLLGHTPEHDPNALNTEDDPRTMNRTKIPSSLAREYLASARGSRQRYLLALLADIHEDSDGRRQGQSKPRVEEEHLLVLTAAGGKYQIAANCSKERSVTVPRSVTGELLYANRLERRSLAPLGYGVWRT